MLHIKEILEQGRTLWDLTLREKILELYLPIIKLGEDNFGYITTKKYYKKLYPNNFPILINNKVYDVAAFKETAALFDSYEHIEQELILILMNHDYQIFQFKDLYALTYNIKYLEHVDKIESNQSWEPLNYYQNSRNALITQNKEEAEDRLQKYKCDLIVKYQNHILNTRLISL